MKQYSYKRGKGQVSLLMALLLTTGATVTAFAVSEMNETLVDGGLAEVDSVETNTENVPTLEALLLLPEMIIRGESQEFRINVTNVGDIVTNTVIVQWSLSPGIETLNQSHNCVNLMPQNSCIAKIQVQLTSDTLLGSNYVKGEIYYG